jgi:S-adenosylmethionine:tRNA ribosyltransferase-isomerase
MIAADRPIQRPAGARLLVVDAAGQVSSRRRTGFSELLQPGDLVVANDAATLPASLLGRHAPTGRAIEVRLAGRASPSTSEQGPADSAYQAVVFGEGDYRIRTEDRPPPPPLAAGDVLALGPLTARIEALLDHPRLAAIRFEGEAGDILAGIARHGRPVQYAHLRAPLQLWDVWTPLAGPPVAFEPPSAGFALDWAMLRAIRARGANFATLTHAAGLSSTGDEALDARLPFPEPYRIPAVTAEAVRRTRAAGGRIVAVGTTVTRALEHAAEDGCGGVRAGDGVADQRIGPGTVLKVVDAIFSGVHEPGTSHYQLLRAFIDDATLARADAVLTGEGYRTHEFGDSVLIDRRGRVTDGPGRRQGRDEPRWNRVRPDAPRPPGGPVLPESSLSNGASRDEAWR